MKEKVTSKEKLEAMIKEFSDISENKYIGQVKYRTMLSLIRKQIKLQLRIYDLYRELERVILHRARRDGYNMEEVVDDE